MPDKPVRIDEYRSSQGKMKLVSLGLSSGGTTHPAVPQPVWQEGFLERFDVYV